jgi:hypothetical protein
MKNCSSCNLISTEIVTKDPKYQIPLQFLHPEWSGVDEGNIEKLWITPNTEESQNYWLSVFLCRAVWRLDTCV